MKKLISLMLSVAMVLSMMVFTISPVSAETTYLNDWFDGYADTPAAKTAGWGDFASGKIQDTLNNGVVKSVSETETSNKCVEIGNGRIAKEINAPAAGKYVLKTSVKAGSNGIIGLVYGNQQHNIVGLTNGIIYAYDSSKGADNKKIGSYTVGNWYDFEITIDSSTGEKPTYSLIIKQGTNVVSEYNDYLVEEGIIYALWIGNWNANSPSSFDNISFKDYVAPVVIDKEVPVEDNFDSYANIAAATSAGWIQTQGVNSIETVDELHGLSLKLDGTQHARVTREVTIAPDSGMYKISFSSKTANELVVQLVDNTTNFNGNALNFYSAMKVQIGGKDAASYTDRWYDTEMILNTADGTFAASIKADGTEIASGSGSYKGQGAGLSKIHFSSWGTNSAYIDNFSVTTYVPPVVEEKEIFSEDFEDYADLSAAYAGGWKDYASNAMQNKLEFSVVESVTDGDAHGKSMGITSGRVAHDFKATEKSGKYMVKASVYVANELFMQVFNGTDTSFTYAVNFLDGNIDVNGDGQWDAAYSKNQWYDLEVIVDIDAGILTTTVYNTDGSVVDKATGSNALTDGKGAAMHRILFGEWKTDSTSYFDDIIIERYYAPPKLTKDSVALTDIAGNVVANVSAPTPGIKSIALNFGTDMKEDTIKVTLNGIEIKGSLSGSVYTIPTGPVLDEKTKYTLKVADGATNTDDVSMGEFVYEFTTAQAVCDVETDGLYSGATKLDNEINKISTLATGGKVNVKLNYANATKTSATLCCVVAYYSDDMLVSAEVIPADEGIASGSAGVFDREITLPDITNVDEISVFAWNGTSAMLPYCNALNLTK